MTCSKKWWWAAALVLAGLAGCGNDSSVTTAPPPSGSVAAAIAAAAAIPTNDTSTNSSSAFSVLQAAGVPAVVVRGAPVVNFTVFSDGAVKQGLTLAEMRFAIAKLVPSSNGNPARWQSYVSRTEQTGCDLTPPSANCVGSAPGNKPVLASAIQATTDPQPAAQADQLVYNADGYYTYTFSTNITDPARTNGVVFEPGLTHRIAIQLSYKNAAGQVVRVNPYFDVTFGANGGSVAVTNPANTQVISDVSSCNACHEKLSLHGGGRVDVQYCVMCHNPGTTDANSGNVLTMATMTHKIHSGRLLADPSTAGNYRYAIWSYVPTRDPPVVEHDYSNVGFPQDLRNCRVCHTEANPATPQGGFWATKSSKEACLTCHANGTGSAWASSHQLFADLWGGAGTPPNNLPNSECMRCHETPSFSPARVHWNQAEEHAAKYKVNIQSASYDPATRKVTVKYNVSDPTDKNALYNLVTPDCTAPAPDVCAVPRDKNNPRAGYATQFGNLRFYLAYANMVGQPTSVTEFTSYNNNGSSANAYLYKGRNDGANNYTIDIALPADTATAVAQGTARVVGIGQIVETELQTMSEIDPRPPVVPTTLINVVAQNTFADVVLTGPMNPRRQVVSNEKCSVCHAALGTTTGSNTKAYAFHDGARHTVESCALCHDQNRMSSTVMTSGQSLQENYSFKRMIHGIHGNSRRLYPFTHGNLVVGAFCNPRNPASKVPLCDPNLVLAPDVTDYAAEVAYPQVGLNCNACHVNNSWQSDPNPAGSVVAKPTDPATGAASTNPLTWYVITPQAASCTACHDSPTAINHMVGAGGAAFGLATQAQSFQTQESCADCHRPGLPFGVNIVHGRR